jgi:hypothetical protein
VKPWETIYGRKKLPKNRFLRITGEPVITGKKRTIFSTANLVKIQMQKLTLKFFFEK